ncbi:MAG: hypothetical protein U0637_02425 [Phycisphaerales bacterium]
MHTSEDLALAHTWLNAAALPPAATALEAIYAQAAAEIAARAPACWASGRCCNFEKAGHRLYATGLETAYLLTHTPPSAHPQAGTTALPQLAAPPPSPAPSCPFLQGNLCSVHTTKPLACRTYFCDRSAGPWQNDLTERALHSIRSLHDTHAIPYRYAEWGWMLSLLHEALSRRTIPHAPHRGAHAAG